MKISELIVELEKIKRASGDLDVEIWPYDGQVETFPVKGIRIFNNKVIIEESEGD